MKTPKYIRKKVSH